MKFAKIMLSITAAIWIIYGGWLFLNPLGLRYMGYELNNWSAIVEVQAMYGLAEVALGIFALLGVLKPRIYMHPALLLWCMIYTGLWVGRVIGIIQWEGTFDFFAFGPDALPDTYNPGALFVLELPSSALMLIALIKTKSHPELNH
ncbi:MAG: hypothetical protein KDI30_07875 [Pseudomonadales bacterium]|nr:hypothetical protein [Pseudomonadales bacterium]